MNPVYRSLDDCTISLVGANHVLSKIWEPIKDKESLSFEDIEYVSSMLELYDKPICDVIQQGNELTRGNKIVYVDARNAVIQTLANLEGKCKNCAGPAFIEERDTV